MNENTHEQPKVTIYTDGGAKPNPDGPGGWGAILIFGDHTKELSGGAESTTNNQMELTAAIQALNALKTPCEVILYTDSQYVKNGITQWLGNWLKNGWKTSNKKPVKNQHLWKALHEATHRHTITWKWVRGHSGVLHNERVDQLATQAREKFRHIR